MVHVIRLLLYSPLSLYLLSAKPTLPDGSYLAVDPPKGRVKQGRQAHRIRIAAQPLLSLPDKPFCQASAGRGGIEVKDTVAYLTSNSRLALWLLNSGAYMHWISAMPV